MRSHYNGRPLFLLSEAELGYSELRDFMTTRRRMENHRNGVRGERGEPWTLARSVKYNAEVKIADCRSQDPEEVY